MQIPAPDVSDVSTAVSATPAEQRRLWLAAIKPPMYTVAIMPVWIGCGIAWSLTGRVQLGIAGLFGLAAICILAWTNISNDYFDSQTGIDVNKPHSLVNLTGDPQRVLWIGNGFLALGAAGIGLIAWWQQDLTVVLMVLICWSLGYLYQGPPFRWGYQGWGEVLCFLSFGPLGTQAVVYSQTQSWSWQTLSASIPLGVVTSLILFCSHFHQVDDDQRAGKRSPVVRLGTQRSAQLIPWICGGLYVMVGISVIFGILSMWTMLSLISLPFALHLSFLLLNHHDQPERIGHSKFIAVKLHFLFCLGLGVGFYFP